MKRILSLGAGVQSSTVLLMSCRGVLPRLDMAIFADTQWEPAAVYRHLDWLTAEASKHDIPVVRVSRGNLRDDALHHHATRTASGEDGNRRWAQMPLFVRNDDGSTGMIRRQCTSEYKIEPITRYLRREVLGLAPRQRAPREPVIEQWFGIDAPEFPHRGRISREPWITFRYPLVFDVSVARTGKMFRDGYGRADCLTWMAENGYPMPPRSACVACPFRSDAEWAEMREADPDSFADACEFDRLLRDAEALAARTNGVRNIRGSLWLHRSCTPLDCVGLTGECEGAATGFAAECRGGCGV